MSRVAIVVVLALGACKSTANDVKPAPAPAPAPAPPPPAPPAPADAASDAALPSADAATNPGPAGRVGRKCKGDLCWQPGAGCVKVGGTGVGGTGPCSSCYNGMCQGTLCSADHSDRYAGGAAPDRRASRRRSRVEPRR